MTALVLVGGTGGLGTEIAKGLVTAEGYDTKKAIVRDSTNAKAIALQDMGWTIVEVSDFMNPTLLEEAFIGATTIVSTLSGKDLASLETAALHAASKVGTVTLYVPSQFGENYNEWGTSHPILAVKRNVLAVAKEVNIPTLEVFVGYFSDGATFYWLADTKTMTTTFIGNASAPISFTRRSDIGYVLAKALNDPMYKEKGGTLCIQGSTMSWKDAIHLLESILKKKFTIEKMSVEDATKLEEELLQKGMKGDMKSFYESFRLNLLGEPERGSTGADVHKDSKTYGVKVETLEETLQRLFG